nr:9246_t:CDS:2 [Entrophospora candida]
MISNFDEFYFVEKAVTEIWIWMWFVHRVWSTDKFSNLRWCKIKAMELKSIITTLLLIGFPMMAIYDISWIKIKYSEGHIGLTSTSADGHNEDKYIEKPYLDPNNSSQIIWSKENQILKETADYLLCAIYSLQTGTLILLQAFWSHLTDQMGDKTFMNSCEFKMYILWSFLSILIFPIPRYMLEDYQLLSEIRTRIKLKELLKKFHRKSLESQETSLRINYFLEMNCLLMIGLLLTSIGFIILFIEEMAITPSTNAQMITINAIFRDFLTVLTNFGNLILWVTIIFIIYPRYHITGLFGSLSLTKKTLNRLSKVIVIVGNDQSSSMTTSDDSEYYEEEDVESDKNKGAQRAR